MKRRLIEVKARNLLNGEMEYRNMFLTRIGKKSIQLVGRICGNAVTLYLNGSSYYPSYYSKDGNYMLEARSLNNQMGAC